MRRNRCEKGNIMSTPTTTQNPIERQERYVAQLEKSNFQYGLTVGAAFVRGIRDIGYKHTGTALDELIDNAYQSGAANVHVVFGFAGGSAKKPSQLAIIDDGSGMIPKMIRAAMLWGGTDRENDRTGFGRFGYGLPSSCVSQGRRFQVFSATAGSEFQTCAIDLDDIEVGKYNTGEGAILVPPAVSGKWPRFVDEHIKKHMPGGELKNGTVVLIEKLDRLTWSTAGGLQENLLRHFGVVYHKMRANMDMWVNDTRVEPIDPLFLTPGFRWYDFDADRAKPLDPMFVDVKDRETKKVLGRLQIRYAYLPPTFASIDKTVKATTKNQNPRWAVMKDYNGFIVSRMGRLIDVVSHSPLTTFMNNDRYIKVEVDFDATLDEEFSVPTSKQQVALSERIWDILEEAGVVKALEQLRKKHKEEKAKLQDQEDTAQDTPRASEQAMANTVMLSKVPPLAVVAKRAEAGAKNLQQEAERRAQEAGKPVAEAVRELESKLSGHLYKVEKRSVPGGNFFEVEQLGGTKMLWLNTASRFYQEVHSGPNSTPALRAALEVLLFCIGDRVLEATDQLRDIYIHEIPEWSRKLEFALGQLAQGVGAAEADDEGVELKAAA
jgi:hypothetical protein